MKEFCLRFPAVKFKPCLFWFHHHLVFGILFFFSVPRETNYFHSGKQFILESILCIVENDLTFCDNRYLCVFSSRLGDHHEGPRIGKALGPNWGSQKMAGSCEKLLRRLVKDESFCVDNALIGNLSES